MSELWNNKCAIMPIRIDISLIFVNGINDQWHKFVLKYIQQVIVMMTEENISGLSVATPFILGFKRFYWF